MLVILLVTPSNSASMIIPPPMVTQRKSSEGGYLLMFINDRNEKTSPLFCSSHGIGSPYPLINLNRINRHTSPEPNSSNTLFLCDGFTCVRNSFPKQYPSIIKPVHGKNASTINTAWLLSML